ncbi:MAG: hypothetical protein KBD14_00790 [Candidatus Pacebacteria bacterium]|nr:hypothetical protein [Candidatus Paceibacterota bacterium]
MILVTRKVFVLNNSGELYKSKDIELEFDLPDLDEVKEFTNKKFKKYGFMILVGGIRIYVLSSNATKKGVKYLYNKGEQKIKKLLGHKIKVEEKKEVSGFIKTISDYKKKISKITHKIKQEEGIK